MAHNWDCKNPNRGRKQRYFLCWSGDQKWKFVIPQTKDLFLHMGEKIKCKKFANLKPLREGT